MKRDSAMTDEEKLIVIRAKKQDTSLAFYLRTLFLFDVVGFETYDMMIYVKRFLNTNEVTFDCNDDKKLIWLPRVSSVCKNIFSDVS